MFRSSLDSLPYKADIIDLHKAAWAAYYTAIIPFKHAQEGKIETKDKYTQIRTTMQIYLYYVWLLRTILHYTRAGTDYEISVVIYGFNI